MDGVTDQSGSQTTWFVGAMYGGAGDQTSRFLAEGIWENGYDDKLLDVVRSMRPRDRIAIKSSYTRKHDLPFDNRGHTVSVMAIKAIGTITENLNDGKRVRVDWKKVGPSREWYSYTHRGTVWRVRRPFRVTAPPRPDLSRRLTVAPAPSRQRAAAIGTGCNRQLRCEEEGMSPLQ